VLLFAAPRGIAGGARIIIVIIDEEEDDPLFIGWRYFAEAISSAVCLASM
jgi:hypothetical protein